MSDPNPSALPLGFDPAPPCHRMYRPIKSFTVAGDSCAGQCPVSANS